MSQAPAATIFRVIAPIEPPRALIAVKSPQVAVSVPESLMMNGAVIGCGFSQAHPILV